MNNSLATITQILGGRNQVAIKNNLDGDYGFVFAIDWFWKFYFFFIDTFLKIRLEDSYNQGK